MLYAVSLWHKKAGVSKTSVLISDLYSGAVYLVILHEGDLGPVHFPPHSELSLFVAANPREVSTVGAVLDEQSEVRLAKREGRLIPPRKLKIQSFLFFILKVD